MEGVRVTLEEAKKWAEVHGNKNGCYSGYGYGYGYSHSGHGNYSDYINGSGYGNDNGGNFFGSGSGNSYGRCRCNDYSYGNGYDGNIYGDGLGIQQINGLPIVRIDGVFTAIEVIHADYAKAYTIRHNVILVPCYVARVGSSFAHGKTLKEAFADAQAKEYRRMPEEERIRLFISQYPSEYEVVSNRELFAIHNALTDSCEFGRKEFCRAHDINLDGSMMISSFLELTKNAYGGGIIKKIIEKYENKK